MKTGVFVIAMILFGLMSCGTVLADSVNVSVNVTAQPVQPSLQTIFAVGLIGLFMIIGIAVYSYKKFVLKETNDIINDLIILVMLVSIMGMIVYVLSFVA